MGTHTHIHYVAWRPKMEYGKWPSWVTQEAPRKTRLGAGEGRRGKAGGVAKARSQGRSIDSARHVLQQQQLPDMS